MTKNYEEKLKQWKENNGMSGVNYKTRRVNRWEMLVSCSCEYDEYEEDEYWMEDETIPVMKVLRLSESREGVRKLEHVFYDPRVGNKLQLALDASVFKSNLSVGEQIKEMANAVIKIGEEELDRFVSKTAEEKFYYIDGVYFLEEKEIEIFLDSWIEFAGKYSNFAVTFSKNIREKTIDDFYNRLSL